MDRTRVAYLTVAGRFFAAANFGLKCKKSVATTLLETRLLYSSETWPPLPMSHAKRLESVQMRWIRKAVKRYRGEGCNETDAQIRAEFSIATVESKIRHRRLGFLAQLRTASPMLRAPLQEGNMRLPWTTAVVGDLVALQGSAAEGGNDAAPSWGCRRVDFELEAVSSHSYWFASSGTG